MHRSNTAVCMLAAFIGCLLVGTVRAQEADPTVAAEPVIGSTYDKISSGVFVTCAIQSGTGDAYCMGNNGDGAVGDATQITRVLPTKVYGDGPWIDISAGDWHACGVKADNTGYCWGFNGGRLGTGLEDPVQATYPQQLQGEWATISAGHFHSCGLDMTGQAWCWGNNKNGRMGTGTTSGNSSSLGGETADTTSVYEFNPQKVKGGTDFVSISARGSHTCGLKGDNTAWCWGGNDDGEIGAGSDEKSFLVPTQVSGQWKYINSGNRISCGISVNNKAYCWGALAGGNQTFEQFDNKPQAVGDPLWNWSEISGGMQHVCGVLVDGTGKCFGLGWHGQLGNGLNYYYAVPQADSCYSNTTCSPTGDHVWKSISAGEYNTCGLDINGLMFCWGENPYGSNGNGQVGGNTYDPTRVLDIGTPVTYQAPGAAPIPAPVPVPAPAPLPVPVPVPAPLPVAVPVAATPLPEPVVVPPVVVADAPAPAVSGAVSVFKAAAGAVVAAVVAALMI